jgi:hypothetical protein
MKGHLKLKFTRRAQASNLHRRENLEKNMVEASALGELSGVVSRLSSHSHGTVRLPAHTQEAEAHKLFHVFALEAAA